MQNRQKSHAASCRGGCAKTGAGRFFPSPLVVGGVAPLPQDTLKLYCQNGWEIHRAKIVTVSVLPSVRQAVTLPVKQISPSTLWNVSFPSWSVTASL